MNFESNLVKELSTVAKRDPYGREFITQVIMSRDSDTHIFFTKLCLCWFLEIASKNNTDIDDSIKIAKEIKNMVKSVYTDEIPYFAKGESVLNKHENAVFGELIKAKVKRVAELMAKESNYIQQSFTRICCGFLTAIKEYAEDGVINLEPSCYEFAHNVDFIARNYNIRIIEQEHNIELDDILMQKIIPRGMALVNAVKNRYFIDAGIYADEFEAILNSVRDTITNR